MTQEDAKEQVDGIDFRFSMEYKGCLIEVALPEAAIPDMMNRKEWLQNSVVDMYARLHHMITQQESKK